MFKYFLSLLSSVIKMTNETKKLVSLAACSMLYNPHIDARRLISNSKLHLLIPILLHVVILHHLLTALDKASKDLNILALSDEQVKDKLARILLEDMENAGIKILASKEPIEIRTKLSGAVVDAIKALTDEGKDVKKEVKGVKETIKDGVKDLKQEHQELDDIAKRLSTAIDGLAKGQIDVMEVIGAENEKTRKRLMMPLTRLQIKSLRMHSSLITKTIGFTKLKTLGGRNNAI
ncbi:MAG: hypothetical protein GWP10_22485 [Nitrospiraceae bacterium]|nr:hypothetical protein [Nitrospiraceae bacterium]